MLSTDLHNIAADLFGRVKYDMPMSPVRIRKLATAISAAALMAEALEATKIAQDTADEMARIMSEQHEGEQG